MNLDTILKWVINAIFMFAGQKLATLKTSLTTIIAMVLGIWTWIDGSGLYGLLCTLGDSFAFFKFFCGFTGTEFYAILLTIIGALQLILTKLNALEVANMAAKNGIAPSELKIGGFTTPLWFDLLALASLIVIIAGLIFAFPVTIVGIVLIMVCSLLLITGSKI